ncbi:MAG: hypothetical protein DI535_19820 [Citrobacter freundii]|nr:MAG: hypothetical protein DI535_19820 [Citrobacter freundii]
MRRVLLFAMAMLCAISYCFSQSVAPATINAAGGTYDNQGSYYRFEWSFGEMLVINSFAPPDSAVLVTHGVLQPCTDGSSNPGSSSFEPADYRLFPNPTVGKFELDFFIRESGQMNLRLVDATGKTLEKRSYAYNGCCSIQIFDLSNHPPGLYYVIAELQNEKRRYSGFKVMRLGK